MHTYVVAVGTPRDSSGPAGYWTVQRFIISIFRTPAGAIIVHETQFVIVILEENIQATGCPRSDGRLSVR